MIPFCDTPKQSMVTAILVGFIAGGLGLYIGSREVVVSVAILLSISLEIILHEYRQDTQYLEAKRSVKESISK